MNNHLVNFPWFKEEKKLAKYRLLSVSFKKKKKRTVLCRHIIIIKYIFGNDDVLRLLFVVVL